MQPLIGNVDQGAAEVLYGLGAAGDRQGDDLAGLIYLRLSIYLDPNNALALLTLGDLYQRINQNEQALDISRTFRRAIRSARLPISKSARRWKISAAAIRR